MRNLSFSLAMLCAFLTSNTAYGQQTIKSDALAPFSKVAVTGKLNVKLVKGDVNSIEIKLDEEVDIAKFKWGIDNKQLSFLLRAGRGTGNVTVNYTDTLTNIAVSGGEIHSAEPIVSSVIEIFGSGGAKLTLALDVLDAELDITSNSTALFTGDVKYLKVKGTEKSVVDTREIEALSVEADSATGAELYVNVLERLIANAKTSSTIFYRGAPVVVKNKTSKMSSGVMGASVLHIGE